MKLTKRPNFLTSSSLFILGACSTIDSTSISKSNPSSPVNIFSNTVKDVAPNPPSTSSTVTDIAPNPLTIVNDATNADSTSSTVAKGASTESGRHEKTIQPNQSQLLPSNVIPSAEPVNQAAPENIGDPGTGGEQQKLKGSYDDNRLNGSEEGIAYFLPRQLTKITAKRTKLAVEKGIEKLVAAEAAAVSAQEKVSNLKAIVESLENQFIQAQGDVQGREIIQKRLTESENLLSESKVKLTTAKSARDEAKNALIMASQTIEGHDEQFSISITLEMQAPTADPQFGFRLNPRHNIFRDDTLSLVVSPNGLLTSSDIQASDRTGEVLVQMATFAGAVYGLNSRTNNSDTKECPNDKTSELTAILDLNDDDQLQALNQSLACMGARVTKLENYGNFKVNSNNLPTRISGIAYRTPITVLFNIEKCTLNQKRCSGQANWFPAETISVSLPQAGPISFLRQNAGAFTNTTYKNKFQNGILTNYDASRPSEFEEIAILPVRALNEAADAAAKIFSYRVDQSKTILALTQNELATAKTRNELAANEVTAQSMLNDAQMEVLRSRLGLQIEGVTGANRLTNAELELLNTQLALQSRSRDAAISAATISAQQQLALLQAQSNLQIGQNTTTAQQSASNAELILALLRDQARTASLNRCVAEMVSNNKPIDPCLIAQ